GAASAAAAATAVPRQRPGRRPAPATTPPLSRRSPASGLPARRACPWRACARGPASSQRSVAGASPDAARRGGLECRPRIRPPREPPMPRFLPRLSVIAWLMLGLAGIVHAEPARYALDPVHTRVLVAVDHAGFSTALGTISGSSGTLRFSPGDWAGARVEVEIPLQRLDFGDEDWNRATLARNLLDADAHPVATFRSTRVEPLDAQQAIVHGLLALRGVSREVALEVRLNGARRHPLPPFRRTVGFSATATLSRTDFGITAWRSMIG